MSAADYRREIGFTLGTIVGITMFAFGVGFLILSLSVGLRREMGGYMPPGVKSALVYGGLVLVVVGILVRLYRSVIQLDDRIGKWGGTGVFVAGSIAFLFGIARETTVSAPFVIDPTQKVLLFVIAFALLIAGGALVRGAARLVGW